MYKESIKNDKEDIKEYEEKLPADPYNDSIKSNLRSAHSHLKKEEDKLRRVMNRHKTELEELRREFIKAANGNLNGSLNGPSYKNLINAALVYNYDYYDDIKVKFSLTGEYGKAATAEELAKKYTLYYEMHNLISGAIGINVDYKGIKFGGSYGHLGKSGLVKTVYEIELLDNPEKPGEEYKKDSQYISNDIESVEDIPHNGSRGLDDETISSPAAIFPPASNSQTSEGTTGSSTEISSQIMSEHCFLL